MIRDITANDKDQIIALAKMFFKERLEREGVTFSLESASHLFDLFLKTPGVLALCAEEDGHVVGMIVGIASAIIFAKDIAMQEMVWYVQPDRRKSGLMLLRVFESRARKVPGVTSVMMVGMQGDPVLDLYPRLGYKETQRTFMKFLE